MYSGISPTDNFFNVNWQWCNWIIRELYYIMWRSVSVTLCFVYHLHGWLMWWEFEANSYRDGKYILAFFLSFLADAAYFRWHILPPLRSKCWFASGLWTEHSTHTIFPPTWSDSYGFHITYDPISPSFVFLVHSSLLIFASLFAYVIYISESTPVLPLASIPFLVFPHSYSSLSQNFERHLWHVPFIHIL